MYSLTVILLTTAKESGISLEYELDHPSEITSRAIGKWMSLVSGSGAVACGEAPPAQRFSSIIFPSDNGVHAEENFQAEEEAARKAGFDILLFDDVAWDMEEKIVWKGTLPARAVYRGWMMKPEVYERFEWNLLGKNVELFISSKTYRKMHCFQNIYEEISGDAVKTLYFPDWNDIDLGKVRATMKRFMVKDEAKSLKGTDFPRCIEADLEDGRILSLFQRFQKMRSDLLTGGCILKEFVDLREYAGKTNEWRMFVLCGSRLSLQPNSGQGAFLPRPPIDMIERMKRLPSSFYTVDFAELADGSWKVIETGDGGVSGLSDQEDIEAFYRAMKRILS